MKSPCAMIARMATAAMRPPKTSSGAILPGGVLSGSYHNDSNLVTPVSAWHCRRGDAGRLNHLRAPVPADVASDSAT